MNKELRTRPATAKDESALRALLRRVPQMGSVTLIFEREPDFFTGARVSCEQELVLVCEELDTPGVLIAMVDIGERRQYINGKSESVRYLHDLRIAPECRGGKVLKALFMAIAEHMGSENDWMEAVILEENLIPLGIIDRGRTWLPGFYRGGRVITSLLPAQSRKTTPDRSLTIRPATSADAPQLQQLWDRASQRQGFPVYNVNDLLAATAYFHGITINDYLMAFIEGRPVACMGLWNQKNFKQTRVSGYAPWLAALRIPYNLYARLFGGIHLPSPGDCFNYLTLHSLVIDQENPTIFKALLDYVLEHHLPPQQCLACGFFDDHPLEAALGTYRRKRLHSRHFLISYHQDPRQTQGSTNRHIEIARL
ncbi:hypothetical protein [Pseudomonas sp. S9]|uniref:hypothetical protein n=1 Tax=Pseudomonas sp. S9 TaxID=686578 RepID=UPI00025575D5|nr:hypothetical protein [Pseudomonas sp. S9]